MPVVISQASRLVRENFAETVQHASNANDNVAKGAAGGLVLVWRCRPSDTAARLAAVFG